MKRKTDWEKVGSWYGSLVGKKGHEHHRDVIFPKLLPLLNLKQGDSLLDLACGQGVLAHQIPGEVRYLGIDLSPSLIEQAKEGQRAGSSFQVGDICAPLEVDFSPFSHATIVLALQNVERADLALKNAACHLKSGGELFLVLNHPCFRIPRQTHWGVDTEKNLQYRRIDRYLSSLKIPIQMNPGKGKKSEITWSFHRSLSDYSRFLIDAGFLIAGIEEWVSAKKSTGGAAKRENRARDEFPLFLTMKCVKTPGLK